jgi:hypothetical protein
MSTPIRAAGAAASNPAAASAAPQRHAPVLISS